MSTDPPPITDVMEERRRLLSLAYRMMGTLTEAEDVVQETYLRWYRQSEEDRAAIRNPAAWLTRVARRAGLRDLAATSARPPGALHRSVARHREPRCRRSFLGTAPGSGS